MGLETGSTIGDLNELWPLGTDPKSQGDDHIRLLKSVLKNTFENLDDRTLEDILGDYLALSGGVMTGPATLRTNDDTTPFGDDEAVPKRYVDATIGTWETRVVPNQENTIYVANTLASPATDYRVLIRCIQSDLGYSVGDMIDVTSHNEGSGGRGNTAFATAGSIGITLGANALFLRPRGGGAIALYAWQSWEVVVMWPTVQPELP